MRFAPARAWLFWMRCIADVFGRAATDCCWIASISDAASVPDLFVTGAPEGPAPRYGATPGCAADGVLESARTLSSSTTRFVRYCASRADSSAAARATPTSRPRYAAVTASSAVLAARIAVDVLMCQPRDAYSPDSFQFSPN